MKSRIRNWGELNPQDSIDDHEVQTSSEKVSSMSDKPVQASQGIQQSEPKQMNRPMWEYCFINEIFAVFQTVDGFRNESVDGALAGQWEWLAKLGQQGWEAYSVSGGVYYLKRRIQ